MEEAKQYFEKHYRTGSSSHWFDAAGKLKTGLTADDIFMARQPDWSRAFDKQISIGKAVQVPLKIGDLLVGVRNNKDVLPLESLHYLLMYKDALDSMHTEWVSLQPDSAWLYGNRTRYTGKISVRSWEGSLIKVFYYNKQGGITAYSHQPDGIRGQISRRSLVAPDPETCTMAWYYNDAGQLVCGWPDPICFDCDNPTDPPTYPTDPLNPGGSSGGTSGGDYNTSCNPDPNYTVPSYPPPTPNTQWQLPCGPVPVPEPSATFTDPTTGVTYTYGEIEQYFNDHPEVVEAFLAGEDIPLQAGYMIGILEGAEAAIEYAVLKAAHPDWNDAELVAVAFWNVLREEFHFALDIVGMIPLVGEAADITNGVIYYLEGDRINAALSVGAAIPVWGWVSTGGKWVRTATKIYTKSISEAAGKIAYRAVKNSKGAVRMVKMAVGAFDHAAIKALKVVKPADQGLTNLKRELLEMYAHRISPLSASLKSKVDDIVANGDLAGTKTEALCHEMFEVGGYQKKTSQFGINNSNGFDGVYIKYDANGNVEEILINEAKQVGSKGNIQLSTTSTKGSQMSDFWRNRTIDEMINNADQEIRNLGNILNANKDKITKTVTGVDKVTGEM